MAKKLNTDGLPVDVPSVLPKNKSDIFRDLTVNPEEEYKVDLPEEPPTRVAIGKSSVAEESHASSDTPMDVPHVDEPKTRIAFIPKEEIKEADKAPSIHVSSTDRILDPVVGWLVIIDGLGKGNALPVGAGQNTLGRGEKARIRIDYGDSEISRDSHAIVTYDPKHNKYYVQPGSGTNLAYLGEEPVLHAVPLTSGTNIILGSTTMRFVALCDDSFTWS